MKIITPEAHASQRIEVDAAIHRTHVQPISAPLHVVAVISNPSRFRTRYDLFRQFEKYVTDSGAIMTTVELALRDRHFEVTTPGPRTVQLRSPDQLWHKENLINIGIRALPADWEYVAWIDADVTFSRPDWVYETLHQLQTMACALITRVDESIHGDMSEPYSRYWRRWQERAFLSIQRNIGYVPGLLLHYWHGAKRDRKYVDRWQILTRNKFDPAEDLIRDAQGLWQLAGNKPQLRDDIRDYFSPRNEDGLDV